MTGILVSVANSTCRGKVSQHAALAPVERQAILTRGFAPLERAAASAMVAAHLRAVALAAAAGATGATGATGSGNVPYSVPLDEPAACSATAFLNNTDFHDGQGLGNAPGKDAADCCTQCASSAWAAKGCKFFTLSAIGSTGTCWFKKDDSGRRYIQGAVSGSVAGPMPGPPPPPPPKAACPDPAKINIACVGDSITFGAHSRGGNTTYPGQLQGMLDAKYPGKYCAVNYGVCGATMQKPPHGDSSRGRCCQSADTPSPFLASSC